MEKDKKIIKFLIFLVAILVISFSFVLYVLMSKDDVVDLNKKNENENISESRNVSDYIKEDYKCINSKYSACFTKIEFSNLPDYVTKDLVEENSSFIEFIDSYIHGDDDTGMDYKCRNELDYEIHDDIVSVFMKNTCNNPVPSYPSSYVLNYDLELKKTVSNKELLEKFGVKTTTMYEKVLNSLVNNVTIDEFLLNPEGNVISDTISLNEFKNKISTYVEILKNNYDVVQLNINDGKLNCSFLDYEILELLGMSSHMYVDLSWKVQTVTLN